MREIGMALLVGGWVSLACVSPVQAGDRNAEGARDSAAKAAKTAKATFAGGCFWCMEPPFDKLEGVISTTSGYTGGTKDDPTYHEVSAGKTGHAEAVQIEYDPSKVTYAELLEVYWMNVDPLVEDQQFCDQGNQYRTAIFYYDDEQKQLAEDSKAAIVDKLKISEKEKKKVEIKTEIEKATEFYPAEDYHQDYYKKNPVRYKFYRSACGRDKRLNELWGHSKS